MPPGVMKDVMDFSGKFNTLLTPVEERKFQEWARTYKKDRDLETYDMRGWWKENNGVAPAPGHFTDKYKKPNHPTFSTESIYSGQGSYIGGEWEGDDTAGWLFKPGPANLGQRSMSDLLKYFQISDPSVKLSVPRTGK